MPDWISEQVNEDFSRARKRAFLNMVVGSLRQQPTALLPFEEVRSRIFIRGQHDLGIQIVPLDRIVGSEGRYTDFDRLFLPRSERTRDRWKSIGIAQYQDVPLPPVELYKMGEIYFVRDGNHRVSVARQRGQLDIDAHVIELQTDVPLTPDLDHDDLLLKEEQSDFYEWTNLGMLRSGVNIQVSVPGAYMELIAHINGHRYFLSQERGAEVSAEEAIVSWYDTVYLPLVSAIRRSHVLEAFPDRTEGDLYLWIMDHRHFLTEQAGQDPGANRAAVDYVERFASPLARRRVQLAEPTPEEQEFLAWSGLERSRPGADLRLSDPEGYQQLRTHIQDHQYYLGLERGAEIPLEDAATSWYDHVYQTVLDAFSRLHVQDVLPDEAPGDLYLLVMSRLSYLRDRGVEIDLAGAAEDYARHVTREKVPMLVGVLHQARRLLGRALLEARRLAF